MTQEKKNLLLKDLCARLPYGIKVRVDRYNCHDVFTLNGYQSGVFWIHLDKECEKYLWIGTALQYNEFKPYLRPMSSMTEEEIRELDAIERNALNFCMENDDNGYTTESIACDACIIDFCNKHHLDYRGLIEKGLALEAPKDMYKFEHL